jgi:signal transduction histidine kinase
MPVIDIYTSKERWKLLLFVIAVSIGFGSLWYTNNLVNRLSIEERKKVELWADATRLTESSNENTDLTFLFKVIENNNTVPVILTDKDNKILSYRNFDSIRVTKPGYLQKQLNEMRRVRPPLVIHLNKGNKNYIYYKESILLQKLTFYPYIQLSVIIIFILVAYLAFNASRKAEQNKVWLGLSRETAHQLGTPASSLMAWIELLRDKIDDQELVTELEKDVTRLNIITERFSKIGSQPKLEFADLNQVVEDVKDYICRRIPETVDIYIDAGKDHIYLPLNINLFSWVIENLIKNALDAIANQGTIHIKITSGIHNAVIDISDNGKGILKRNFKRVFKPGYTTKARGWGLGLSLTKRITEEYHKGRIFVLKSEIGEGTTFRIILPKKNK